MSRSTGWIVTGIGMLVPGGIMAGIGFAEGSGAAMFFGGALTLAGLFAIQIGVMALAVSIGVYEVREAIVAQGRNPLPPENHRPPERQHTPPRPPTRPA